MDSDRLNFCHQNLQSHSFSRLQLNDANFSGADVRGCDFSYAQLQRANFIGAKFGQIPRVFIGLRITGLIILLIVFPAISQMGFGVLGNTPETPTWSYIVALVISLAISGIGASLRRIFIDLPILERVITTFSGIASAALIGFYYGGSLQNNNPQFAAISALIASITMAILCLKSRSYWILVMISVAGFICSYALTFLVSSVAFAHLSTQNYVIGGIWGILTVVLLGLTMRSLNLASREITTNGITKFKGANLDNAKFDPNFNHKLFNVSSK
jgi:hypothetical protein